MRDRLEKWLVFGLILSGLLALAIAPVRAARAEAAPCPMVLPIG